MAEYEHIPRNGSITAGLTTGIIGTALGALNSTGMLGGMMGGAIEDRHITRHEMDLIREIQDKDQALAIKESEAYTDKKLVEVYTQLAKQDREIRAEVEANYRAQQDINTQQAVYNGTNSATLACMRNSIEQLMSLTALRIPNTSVCPGWGPVTVTPGT